MSGAAPFAAAAGAAPGSRAPSRTGLRALWAIDERARLVELATRPAGRLALVALFALVLVAPRSASRAAPALPLLLVACAAACAYLPRHRPWLFAAATLVATVAAPGFGHEGLAAVLAQEGRDPTFARALLWTALALLAAAAAGAFAVVRRSPDGLLARRPVQVLLATEALLCALASAPFVHGAPRVALWAALSVLAAYTWFLAYAIVDQRSRQPSPLPFAFGAMHPFWGSSATPLGKGPTLLRRVQPRDANELAVTQLKGLKLLAWSVVLAATHRAAAWLLEERLGVPRLEAVQAAFVRGEAPGLAIGWISLGWAVASAALRLAVWGHQAIAIARLAGFRLPRNTWRPLASRTLADFWNRYYYYFKELLVEFFFLPTFLRAFRARPRLRVFVATFMAAGVGNAVYHFVRDLHLVATHGLAWAVGSYASYAFYCAALATGIALSQLRATSGRPAPTGRFAAIRGGLVVWTVVLLLHPFGNETRELSLAQRFAFVASLFGVNG